MTVDLHNRSDEKTNQLVRANSGTPVSNMVARGMAAQDFISEYKAERVEPSDTAKDKLKKLLGKSKHRQTLEEDRRVLRPWYSGCATSCSDLQLHQQTAA